jgi:hypothetical protein
MLSVEIKAIIMNAIMLYHYAECGNKANYAECNYSVSLCSVSQLRQL